MLTFAFFSNNKPLEENKKLFKFLGNCMLFKQDFFRVCCRETACANDLFLLIVGHIIGSTSEADFTAEINGRDYFDYRLEKVEQLSSLPIVFLPFVMQI